MVGGPDKPKLKPGEAMHRALESLEPHLRPLCLQDLEAEARRDGNLAYLREIKAYKAIAASAPTSNPTPTKDSPSE